MGGYCGGLTPLASPVARFTFDKKTPVKTSQAKISLRSSSGKKRRRGKGAAAGGNNFFKREMLFNPVVQMYDVNTWPSSLRLLSPVHLVAMLMVSLFLAVSGIILYPHGYILSAILSFLISFLIFGSLVILATSIIARKNGVPFNRLKLRA